LAGDVGGRAAGGGDGGEEAGSLLFGGLVGVFGVVGARGICTAQAGSPLRFCAAAKLKIAAIARTENFILSWCTVRERLKGRVLNWVCVYLIDVVATVDT